MTDVFDHSGMPEDELLAAEYALGVLAGADRAAVERRIASERGFASMVADWEQRLAPWAGELDEVSPPPQVWDAIAAALPAAEPPGAAADTAEVGQEDPRRVADHDVLDRAPAIDQHAHLSVQLRRL